MTLESARLELDRIDLQLASLFYERMAVIDQIAAIKAGSGQAVRNEARERQVTDRLADALGPAYQEQLLQLYELIFALSRARQQALGAGR